MNNAMIELQNERGLFHDPFWVPLAKENESLHRFALVVFFNCILIQTAFDSYTIEKSPGFAEGFIFFCGERGIRTPGTLERYDGLANR
jgi:hypothetical protein